MATWECDNCGATCERRTGPCPTCRLSSTKRKEISDPPKDNTWLSSLVDDLHTMRDAMRARVVDSGEVFGLAKVVRSCTTGDGHQEVEWESRYAKGSIIAPMNQ